MPTLRKIKRAAIPTHKPTQIAAHLILPNRTQSRPTTRQPYKRIVTANETYYPKYFNLLCNQNILTVINEINSTTTI
jgi:hypothetical protein